MLSNPASIMYHSMTYDQFAIALDFISLNTCKFDGYDIYDKYPLENPMLWPKQIEEIFGGINKMSGLFRNTGFPSKDSNGLDANRFPLPKQKAKEFAPIHPDIANCFKAVGEIARGHAASMAASSVASSSTMPMTTQGDTFFNFSFQRTRDNKKYTFAMQVSSADFANNMKMSDLIKLKKDDSSMFYSVFYNTTSENEAIASGKSETFYNVGDENHKYTGMTFKALDVKGIVSFSKERLVNVTVANEEIVDKNSFVKDDMWDELLNDFNYIIF